MFNEIHSWRVLFPDYIIKYSPGFKVHSYVHYAGSAVMLLLFSHYVSSHDYYNIHLLLNFLYSLSLQLPAYKEGREGEGGDHRSYCVVYVTHFFPCELVYSCLNLCKPSYIQNIQEWFILTPSSLSYINPLITRRNNLTSHLTQEFLAVHIVTLAQDISLDGLELGGVSSWLQDIRYKITKCLFRW